MKICGGGGGRDPKRVLSVAEIFKNRDRYSSAPSTLVGFSAGLECVALGGRTFPAWGESPVKPK